MNTAPADQEYWRRVEPSVFTLAATIGLGELQAFTGRQARTRSYLFEHGTLTVCKQPNSEACRKLMEGYDQGRLKQQSAPR